MKTSTKILIGASAAVAVAAVYAKKKYDDYSEVIEKLDFKISKLSNIKVKITSIFFDIDVTFFNPTSHDFSINTLGLISVRKIRVLRDGVFIGEANSNLTKFAIPAWGKVTVKQITIETKFLNLLTELSNFTSLTDLTRYKLEIVVEALGQTYVIEQPMA